MKGYMYVRFGSDVKIIPLRKKRNSIIKRLERCIRIFKQMRDKK